MSTHTKSSGNQSKATAMTASEVVITSDGAEPALEDVQSVGTRICWGSIAAGATIALGIYFLLGSLGTAVGLSIGNGMKPESLTNGALIWAIVTTCVSMFLGGMVASTLTVGENKFEAVLYGVIMWAILLAVFVALSAAGIHTGFNAMAELSNTTQTGEAAVSSEVASRIAWYAFAGIWLSMMTAALGSLVGAGPTFRFAEFYPLARAKPVPFPA